MRVAHRDASAAAMNQMAAGCAPGAGRFFTNENDVTGAVAACLGEQFVPRAWFRAVHGPDHAASRFAEALILESRFAPALRGLADALERGGYAERAARVARAAELRK